MEQRIETTKANELLEVVNRFLDITEIRNIRNGLEVLSTTYLFDRAREGGGEDRIADTYNSYWTIRYLLEGIESLLLPSRPNPGQASVLDQPTIGGDRLN